MLALDQEDDAAASAASAKPKAPAPLDPLALQKPANSPLAGPAFGPGAQLPPPGQVAPSPGPAAPPTVAADPTPPVAPMPASGFQAAPPGSMISEGFGIGDPPAPIAPAPVAPALTPPPAPVAPALTPPVASTPAPDGVQPITPPPNGWQEGPGFLGGVTGDPVGPIPVGPTNSAPDGFQPVAPPSGGWQEGPGFLGGVTGDPVGPIPVGGTNTGPPTPGSIGTSNTAPTLTPTDPNHALTDQTISYGPLADRFGIANQRFSDFVKSSDPAYQAALRSATQHSAAAGGIGSGMLRTEYGNLENLRAQQLDSGRNNFLSDALTGSIGDTKDAANLAEREQGFQKNQQDTAFNHDVTQTQLHDSLLNSDFGRALARLTAGNSGNPADTQLMLSKIFGDQSSAAGQSLAALLRGNATAAGSAQSGSQMDTLLQQILRGMTGAGNTGVPNAGQPDTQDGV